MYDYTHTLRQRILNKESETHTNIQRDPQTLRERQIPRERQKYTERHRQRHTETCKLRGTPILRETPSSRKRHTVLRVRYIHTHTEAEKSKQGE